MERPLREKEHRLKVPRNNLTFFSRLHSFPSFTRRSENKMFWHMPRPRNYIGLEWKCLYKTACPQPITLTIHKFRVRSKPNTFFLSHNRITSKFHPSFEGIHQISCRRRMERKIAFNLLIRSSGGIAQNTSWLHNNSTRTENGLSAYSAFSFRFYLAVFGRHSKSIAGGNSQAARGPRRRKMSRRHHRYAEQRNPHNPSRVDTSNNKFE